MGGLGSKQLQLGHTAEVLKSTFSKGLLKVTKGYGLFLANILLIGYFLYSPSLPPHPFTEYSEFNNIGKFNLKSTGNRNSNVFT